MWSAIVVVFMLGGPYAGQTFEFRQPADNLETCQRTIRMMIATLPGEGEFLATTGSICIKPINPQGQVDRGV